MGNMNELIDKAMKEGVSVGDEPEEISNPKGDSVKDTQDAKVDSSPADSAKDDANSGSGPAKAVAPQAEVEEPWHKSKRFQKVMQEQTELKTTVQKLIAEREQLERLVAIGKNSVQTGNPMPDDQAQLVVQLAKMMKEVPGAAKLLGLEDVQTLQKELQDIKTARQKESFDSEFDKVLSTYSTKYGFKRDEVEEEFLEFLDENAFGSEAYRPGLLEHAFKAMWFDRVPELSERSANLKLIKEQKEKKSMNTATPSKGDSSKSSESFGSLREMLKNTIAKEGGVTVD